MRPLTPEDLGVWQGGSQSAGGGQGTLCIGHGLSAMALVRPGFRLRSGRTWGWGLSGPSLAFPEPMGSGNAPRLSFPRYLKGVARGGGPGMPQATDQLRPSGRSHRWSLTKCETLSHTEGLILAARGTSGPFYTCY